MKKLFHHQYELRHEESEKSFKIVYFKTSGMQFHTHSEQHDYYEVVYHKFSHPENNPCVYVDSYKYPLNDNCWTIFPPHCRHNVERTGAETTLINFRYEFIEPIADFLELDKDTLFTPAIILFSDSKNAELKELASEINTEYYKNINPQKNIRLRLLFANFLYSLFHDGQKTRPENIKELKITTIIDFININYADDLTLDHISEKFFVSKYEICRKIKSTTGLTFSEYLTRVRINHSRELLEESRLSVNEISSIVGYSSPSYYSAAFKKLIGVSPNKYRHNYFEQKEEK